MKTLRAFAILIFALLAGRVLATTYDVGPGKPRLMLRNVPWAALQPGDVVNIYPKPGGYREKIQISASGTAAQHIVIRGIPDPATGALPIIDGKDAVEDPAIDWRSGNAFFSDKSLIVVTPRHTGYVYGVTHVKFVDIETLDIRNATWTADGSITYTDKFGVVRGYDTFTAGICIEWAHDLTVRGCEISNCCQGVFANSKNLAAQSSQRLLIEKCYFHDNSNPRIEDPANPGGAPLSNGFGEHHIYTESVGCIIQFNRFGKHRPGARGVAIKDRSSGQVIRYNEFVMNGQSNVLNLADPQGGAGLIDAQPDYRDSWVYGNKITVEDYDGSISMFFWGAFNGPNFYAVQHRGTLHLYNNTIVSHHKAAALLLMPDASYTGGSPTLENVDCRNNIIFTDTALQGNVYNAFHFFSGGTTNGGGDVTLGKNWISPGWLKESPGHAWGGSLIGTANLLVGDAAGANDPRFADMASRDYHVLIPSNILDAAGPLNPLVLPDHDVTLEYLPLQSSQPRVMQGVAMDLGALESTGLAIPPPPGGALQFSAQTFNRVESGGSATITVTRVGGSMGAVGVSYSTAAGGSAIEGGDYEAVIGTLAWQDGEVMPKTFNVPIVSDTEIEAAETVVLSLFAPTGGAVLGALDSATLTIQDDDAPPSTLMYAIGNTSNALFLFKSQAPGTPLSFTIPSGLVASDSLRALAVQPVTGKLFAVGTAGVLYTVNPFTGVAAAVGPAFSPTPAGSTFDLAFDRVSGLLRLFTTSGQNLSIHPATGAVISIDTAPAYAAGDAYAAITPQIVGADFALNGGVQTLHAIDAVRDTFVRISDPASGQLTTTGMLGFNTETQASLKIQPDTSFGWASLSLPGATGTGLYVVNLNKGNAIFMGAIRTVEQVRDFVIAPPRDVWKQTRFGTNAGNPQIGGDTADPDGNGVNNLMEYALGAEPGSQSATFMPVPGNDWDFLSLTFARAANDVIYTVQVSDDLVAWHDGSVYSPYGDTPANAFTTEIARVVLDNVETITVRDNVATSASSQRFMRLQVTTP